MLLLFIRKTVEHSLAYASTFAVVLVTSVIEADTMRNPIFAGVKFLGKVNIPCS